MELSQEERDRIYAEEKARAEAREKAEKEIKRKRWGPGKVLVACLAVGALAFLFSDLGKWMNGQSEGPAPDDAKHQEAAKPTWDPASYQTKVKPGSSVDDYQTLVLERYIPDEKASFWFARVNDVVYVIRSVEFKKNVGDQIVNQQTNGTFMVVKLDVANAYGKKPVNLPLSLYRIKDVAGTEFSPSSEAMVALRMAGDKSAAIGGVTLQPGVEKQLTMAYEVPAGERNFVLDLPDGLIGRRVPLPLIGPVKK